MVDLSCLQVALWLCVCVAIYCTVRSIVCWKARQYLTSTTPRPPGATLYARLFNPLRRSLDIRPLRIIPYIDATHRDEAELLERADRLAHEIRAVLKQSPLADIHKTDCERQVEAVTDHLVNSLWMLSHLRRIDRILAAQPGPDNQARQISVELQTRLRAEMNRSIEQLAAIPLSLLQMELARGDIRVDRLARDMDETDKRLADLSASYAETKAVSSFARA